LVKGAVRKRMSYNKQGVIEEIRGYFIYKKEEMRRKKDKRKNFIFVNIFSL
jgi:hypothetical protein